MLSDNPTAILLDSGGGWLSALHPCGGCFCFKNPLYSVRYIPRPYPDPLPGDVLITREGGSEIVRGADPLGELDRHLEMGFYAVGYLGYELSVCTDTGVYTRKPGGHPYPDLYFLFFSPEDVVQQSSPLPASYGHPLRTQLPPDPPANPEPDITSDEYVRMVEGARRYIADGDVYQVNLSQRFRLPITLSPYDYLQALFLAQPVPFGCLITFPEFTLVSGSMELFLRKRGGTLTTKPIKGTRPRDPSPYRDRALREELLASPKERAENLMIVDLMRNDLAKVTLPGTVSVRRLLSVESYATVHQMVSEVVGEVKPGVTTRDIIRATFPPGSVTGTPKKRAQEIISELEHHSRGFYCGAIGVFYPNGDFTLSVAIRVAALTEGSLTYWVGGGIVWDSDPWQEYEETLVKARAFTRALGILEKAISL